MPSKEEMVELCYSVRSNSQNNPAGVILIENIETPLLWTLTMRAGAILPPDNIKIYQGPRSGYKVLVNGRHKLTKDGKDYCIKNNIEQSNKALRSISKEILSYDTLKELKEEKKEVDKIKQEIDQQVKTAHVIKKPIRLKGIVKI